MLNGTSIARLLYWRFGEWTYFYIWPFFCLKPETKNTKFTTFLRYLCEKHAFQKNYGNRVPILRKKHVFLRKKVDFFTQKMKK